MGSRYAPDRAEQWIRQNHPDDDYLPPAEPRRRNWVVTGHIDDDEGMDPEAPAIAERHAAPEARRSHERPWREGAHLPFATHQGERRLRMTWTSEDYREPTGPGSVRHQQVASRPHRPSPELGWSWEADDEESGGQWRPPWEQGEGIDRTLLTAEDRAPGHTGRSSWPWGWPASLDDEPFDDVYEERAWALDEPEDDRPLWEQQLQAGAFNEPDSTPRSRPKLAPAARRALMAGELTHDLGAASVGDAPVEDPGTRMEDAGTCGNPAGCEGRTKAKQRCGPCHEYRRTHRGAERPKRLINRAKARRTTL